jgi:hypothetical protein
VPGATTEATPRQVGFRRGVVPAHAGAADAGPHPVVRAELGELTRRVLPRFEGSSQHCSVGRSIGTRRVPRPGSSRRASCGGGAIGVLVRAALPGAVRVAEVDLNAGVCVQAGLTVRALGSCGPTAAQSMRSTTTALTCAPSRRRSRSCPATGMLPRQGLPSGVRRREPVTAPRSHPGPPSAGQRSPRALLRNTHLREPLARSSEMPTANRACSAALAASGWSYAEPTACSNETA